MESSAQSDRPAILFVDDEATAVKYFQRAIGALAPVITGTSVAEGKQLLDLHGHSLSVLISDQRMPGESGNELLRYAADRFPGIVRILTTAYSDIDQTVEAVNQGHIDRYIKKPWDITMLRMELRQALDLAGLRKERDDMVEEKLSVLQRQTLATRIGMLYALSASLLGPDRFQPVDTYLSAAQAAGIVHANPNWLLMDYAEVIAMESRRFGAFGHAVRNAMDSVRQHLNRQDDIAQTMQQLLGHDIAAVGGDRKLLWNRRDLLAELLARPADEAVSADHALWFALLLRLDEIGSAVDVAQNDGKIVMNVIASTGKPADMGRLATWIERL